MAEGKKIKILKKGEKEWKWAKKLLGRAKYIAENESPCYSRKCGAVIARENIDLSTGYNGPPRGISHCETRHPENKKECPRRYFNFPSGQGLHLCPALHAEENAILLAGWRGVDIKGATIYLYDKGGALPCKNCALKIIQAGLKEVVCFSEKEYDERPEAIKTLNLFNEAGVEVSIFKEKEILD